MSVLLSRAVQKFRKINLRVKLFLAGIFVAVEGSSYIIMYALLRITNLNIATQDIMTSIMLLLSTLAHNAVFPIAILVGAFGNFMGSSAGPIRGSIISEINAPEEKKRSYRNDDGSGAYREKLRYFYCRVNIISCK
ncbi:MAG: hypothetical protein Q6351_006410 [Candidatus Njordarchaeum guaymaensis]